jgi:ABC-2 type transport system permease protein
MRRLRALLVKEFIQMRRDRMTFAMMVVLPIVQLLIFGFAIQTDVKHLRTIVFDRSLSAECRSLLDSFVGSGYFDVVASAGDFRSVEEAVASGRVKVGILFPPDYARRLGHGGPAQVQVIVDASDSMAASSAIAAAQMIGQLKSREILTEQRGGRRIENAVDVRIRPWFNPDFVTSWYMVPGILGMILTMTMVIITSMAIVRERERGTLEQLLVTPMRKQELLLSKILPYILVGYVQMTLALLVGVLVFDLPIRGSLGLFYALTSLFLVASLALGLLISSAVRTQMQAMQLSFFIFMPSVLLSGFMFPREAMPKFFQWLGAILPITPYMELSRGIILKGIGLPFLWGQVGALTAFILVVFTASVLKFKDKVA